MSTPLYTQYDGHESTTFVVSNSVELKAAMQGLAGSDGGTILLDGDGGPYDLRMSNFGSSDTPILITSADPDKLAVFTSLQLTGASHVTFDNLSFDHSSVALDLGLSDYDIRVGSSDHIEFTSNVMTGTANGMATYESSSIQGGNLALIQNSSDVSFAGNIISEYFHGVAVFNSQQITFEQNEVTAMQGDGFRGGGIEGGVISNNYFHDFYGAIQTITHNDMIQLWGTSVSTENKQILIDGNILDSGEGAATQGIFIRNETFGEGGPASGYFEDITITNNTIYNGMPHGINLSDTIGGVVANNTVLWNDDTGFYKDATTDIQSYGPWINGSNTINTQFTDNAARMVTLNGVEQHDSNLALNYTDPTSPNYAYDHFVNAGLGGSATLEDIQISSDSQYYNVYGAKIESQATEAVVAEPAFIAASITYEAEADAPVDPLIAIDFTPSKTSTNTTSYQADTSEGFRMSGENQHVFEAEDYDMFGLDKFEMSVRFKIDQTDDAAGSVLRLAGSFSMNTYQYGGFKFRLVTEDGAFEIYTPQGIFSDGEFHDVHVMYDGDLGVLRLSVDGELIEEIPATGSTTSGAYNDLILGSSFGSSAEGYIDTFNLTVPNSSAEAEPVAQQDLTAPISNTQEDVVQPEQQTEDPTSVAQSEAPENEPIEEEQPELGQTEFNALPENKVTEITVIRQDNVSDEASVSSSEIEAPWKVNGFLGSNYDSVVTNSSVFTSTNVFAESPSVKALPFTNFGDDLPWIVKNWLLDVIRSTETNTSSGTKAEPEEAVVTAEFESPMSSSSAVKIWSEEVDTGDAIWGYLAAAQNNQSLAETLNMAPVEDYDTFIM